MHLCLYIRLCTIISPAHMTNLTNINRRGRNLFFNSEVRTKKNSGHYYHYFAFCYRNAKKFTHHETSNVTPPWVRIIFAQVARKDWTLAGGMAAALWCLKLMGDIPWKVLSALEQSRAVQKASLAFTLKYTHFYPGYIELFHLNQFNN